MKLELPYPPTLNTYYRHVGRQVLISAAGRNYRQAVAAIVLSVGRGPTFTGSVSVELEVWVPDQRRRDLDNLCKPLLDALAAAGIYRDDSQIDMLKLTRRGIVRGGQIIATIEGNRARSIFFGKSCPVSSPDFD